MKHGIVFLLFAFSVSIMLASCGQSLTDEELQKRAEDYVFLSESLSAVGYNNNFTLKESNSLEDNLKRLWLKESYFNDDRKNAELLILLGSFDFIAEGLQSKSLYDLPYRTPPETVTFSDDEVLWLMLLLPDADFPESHIELRELLAECGANVLQRRVKDSVWIYFEITSPGLLERLHPSFYWDYDFPVDMADALRNADDDIQNRFMQAIDVETFRCSTVKPARTFSFAEAEDLMREFPPTGLWDGGYIRFVDPFNGSVLASVVGANTPSIYEYKSDDGALAVVTNPADARFAVYEEYTDREYYATYFDTDGSGKAIDVYLWNLHICIVDLLTGEEIFSESVRGNPPPDEISFPEIFTFANISDGEYNHDDFDYDRYAAVMEAHMK